MKIIQWFSEGFAYPSWRRALLLLVAFPIATPTLAGVNEIVSLSGSGEYRAKTEKSWHEAHLKQTLDLGSYVRTGDLSAMAILFADQTQMRLAQNSMVQIKEMPDWGETVLELNAGRVWAQAKRKIAAAEMRSTNLTIRGPSAAAGIRGTDWEMEVDGEGRTRLVVLHGVVEFYNEQGSVTVRNNEQALAEKGKAPVKMLLQNPAEHIQWVTSYVVDAARYAELSDAALVGATREVAALREVKILLGERKMQAALERLETLMRSMHLESGVAYLLGADFAIYAGNLGRAEEILRQGRQRFPADPRFAAQRARVAMLRDDLPGAREWLKSGYAVSPAALELRLAEGEIARFAGEAGPASAAYRAAMAAAPLDARGWHGLGAVESEREEVKQARPHLLQALELDAASPDTRGELATLETFANRFADARRYYDQALQEHPDDYVALTGLGLMLLKAGDTGQALDTLLRASVIEPKYARAVVYTAVAYYQLGRHRHALDTLARAAELDPRDPLPHQLTSLIYTDLVEPGKALDAAREALRRMPYLKSLNQLANDQKGAANLGNALAQFGLEDWAMNYAQESYTPFWAGSHLFLADRYDGKFNKQSELMQGYLTDPTAFGASNRFQTLLTKPGDYFSANLTPARSDDLRTTTASFITNGYANGTVPLAYFAEGMKINLTPGREYFDGDGSTVTAALGAAPREDFGVFAFTSVFEAAVDAKVNPLLTNRTTGRENRLDVGANYKFAPTSQSWLKLGVGEENARNDMADRQQGRSIDTRFDTAPRNRDVQLRHSLKLDDDVWSWGVENTRMDNDTALTSNSALTRIRNDVGDVDKSWNVYLADRRNLGERLTLDLGLFYERYEKTSDNVTKVSQGGYAFSVAGHDAYLREGLHPRMGLAFARVPGEVWRFAYQKWVRPNTANTLSPVATAGIALDNQLVLPGGELERLRFQVERELTRDAFAALFIDGKRVNNLGQPGNVLNQGDEIANLDRLRNRTALVFQSNGEALEDLPAFQQGRALSAGVALNQRLADSLSAYANYVYSESENTHEWLAGLKLPYLARHHATLGMTWAGPQRLVVQAAAVYRSRRFSNEENTAELPAGWDIAGKANWQSADKRWLVEGYAINLLKKDSAATLGLNVAWRY
ncbi:MAG: TonB-dependent receptor [Sulfuricella sp.]|nr:TonB-dependent receptor [Sulfuricella sp.]